MESSHISEETIAQCRALLDALPPRSRRMASPWQPDVNQHLHPTQLALLTADDLAPIDARPDRYGLVNA